MQNYFDILGLSADYSLDPVALEKAYFAAQRATHPDLAVGKPEAERIAAFQKSQLVNEAYEALKSPLARAERMLLINGKIVNDEEDKNVPPSLLMEMMELRERLAETGESGVELNAVVTEIKEAATACHNALESAFVAGDHDTASLETMRLSYLGRAMEEAHMLIYRLKAKAAGV